MITGCACVHARVHTLVCARACVYMKSARLKNFLFIYLFIYSLP